MDNIVGMIKKLHPDSSVITALGGTFAVAKLCDVRPPSVSVWRKTGIPKARLMFLRLARPDIFGPAPLPRESPYPIQPPPADTPPQEETR